MSLFRGNRVSGHRTSGHPNPGARAITLAALALAAGGLLTACGSDDSTATSNPVPTSAAASTSASGGSSGAASTTASAAPTSPGAAATAPPEQPQNIEGFPGPTVVEVSPEAQKFLDGLEAKGVTPTGDGSIAVNTANYICAAGTQTDDEVRTFVTAFVGQEASAAGKQITPEQAGADAQTYIDVAHSTYCK